MITIISPSKTIKEDNYNIDVTKPTFESSSRSLIKILKEKSPEDLMSLMKISEKLALLNMERYHNFNKNNAYPAGFLFRGDVFRGLDIDTFSKENIVFANEHLRILSGLYGILKVTDAIKPYRLEMGIPLENSKGKNLYEFWGERLIKEIKKTKTDTIINLASKEYSDSITKPNSHLKKPLKIIDITFLEKRKGKLVQISFNSKFARGLMASWIIKNEIDDPEKIKEFIENDYEYRDDLSKDNNFVFVKWFKRHIPFGMCLKSY